MMAMACTFFYEQTSAKESVTTYSIGSKIKDVFPDPRMAQKVADQVSSTQDVEDIITATMVNNTTNIAIYDGDNITDISGIEVFVNLDYFVISNANLSDVPSSLSALTELEHIAISNSKLPVFPSVLLDMPTLKVVYLVRNQIPNISSNIDQLSSLTTLSLEHNNISEVPDSISNITTLKELGLSSNNIKKIPDNIGNLTSLKNLTIFDNSLVQLPNSICQLKNIIWLNAGRNQLTSLPSCLPDMNSNDTMPLAKVMFRFNLLPDNYAAELNSAFGTTIVIERAGGDQRQLDLDSSAYKYNVSYKNDYLNLNLKDIVQIEDPYTGLVSVSQYHSYKLDKYVDENNNPIDINGYFGSNNQAIKDEKIYAQVRAIGTGVFPNNSDNALSIKKVELNISAIYYKLSFDLNGGIGSKPAAQSLVEGDLASKVKNPTKSGYKFIGWNTKKDGTGKKWNFLNSKMPAKNITLYAIYSKVEDTKKPIEDIPSSRNESLVIFGLCLMAMSGSILIRKRMCE
ncbi:putative repeat protein (TIGR02543 family) [Bacilli bacterium PM5-3]|nr:putative repeat protein (TIGR02543 family) [Bacilli bacterium PM5-3]